MKTLERALRAGKNEWRTHATSALGVGVAFLCLAFTLISTVNLKELERRWEDSGRISVYLTLTATDTDIEQLSAALKASDGVVEADFVASEDARAELLSDLRSPLLEALPSEAFPPSIEVKLTPEAARSRGELIAGALLQLPAVESIETYGGWAERINELVGAATIIAWVLAGIVFLAVVAVVAATTRLALERRREEVEVLRIVGATSAYVRAPFLVEGAVQGALGAGLALLMSGAAFHTLSIVFGEQLMILLGAEPRFLPWTMAIGLLVAGATLGSSAAYFSLRKSFVQ